MLMRTFLGKQEIMKMFQNKSLENFSSQGEWRELWVEMPNNNSIKSIRYMFGSIPLYCNYCLLLGSNTLITVLNTLSGLYFFETWKQYNFPCHLVAGRNAASPASGQALFRWYLPKPDEMVIPPWLGCQSLVCGNRVHREKVRLTVR